MYDPLDLRVPQYDDASDYTTNSPSYYDYLAKLNALIKQLAEKVGFYDEELKKRFDEWDDLISKFPENVEKLLIQWLNDGTLEQIINENIFNDLNDDIAQVANDLLALKNEYNTFLEHFIINIDEFEGTDTFKIQSALNKATILGGGTVYVPARRYELTKELNITSNTTLWAVEGAVFVRKHGGYMIMNGARSDNYPKYTGNGNIKFINGEWDGNSADPLVTGVGSNFAIAHAENVLFDNVTITNANSHHIELNSSKNVTIRNCKILGQLASLQFVEGIQLDLATKNGFGAFGAYDATPCKNVHIHNCVFGASKTMPALTRGIGTHATRIGAFMENVVIENNTFEELRDFAIQLLCYKDSIIKDNVFTKCEGGIICYPSNPENENHIIDIYEQVTTAVQPCTNITIENNTFKTMKAKQLMYSYGRTASRNNNFVLRGNKVFDCLTASGIITVVNTDNISIEDNIIKNTGVFPVYIRNCTFINVVKNTIELSTHTGIRLEEKIRYAHITNNKVMRVGGNSINVFNDSYSVIISDNICIGANGVDLEKASIYSHSKSGKIIISNNIVRPLTGYTYEKGIYVTNTNTNCVVVGNMVDAGTDPEQKIIATTSTIGENY